MKKGKPSKVASPADADILTVLLLLLLLSAMLHSLSERRLVGFWRSVQTAPAL